MVELVNPFFINYRLNFIQVDSFESNAIEIFETEFWYIDLDADRFQELDASEELHDFTGQGGVASQKFADACRMYAEEEYLDGLRSFTDLSTLRTRLGARPNITYEFKSRVSGWCRAAFITVKSEEADRVSRVIFAVQHIQEEKEQELKFIYKGNLKEILAQLQTLDLQNLLIEEPSLEEIFLHYYEKEEM